MKQLLHLEAPRLWNQCLLWVELLLSCWVYVESKLPMAGNFSAAAAAAKSLQLCLTLCNPIDGSPPGSPVPGILQARTLERVAISFSNAWEWKLKVKSLSRVRPLATPWTTAHQAPPSMGFSRQEYWSGVPLPSPNFSEVRIILPIIIQCDSQLPSTDIYLNGCSYLSGCSSEHFLEPRKEDEGTTAAHAGLEDWPLSLWCFAA